MNKNQTPAENFAENMMDTSDSDPSAKSCLKHTTGPERPERAVEFPSDPVVGKYEYSQVEVEDSQNADTQPLFSDEEEDEEIRSTPRGASDSGMSTILEEVLLRVESISVEVADQLPKPSEISAVPFEAEIACILNEIVEKVIVKLETALIYNDTGDCTKAYCNNAEETLATMEPLRMVSLDDVKNDIDIADEHLESAVIDQDLEVSVSDFELPDAEHVPVRRLDMDTLCENSNLPPFRMPLCLQTTVPVDIRHDESLIRCGEVSYDHSSSNPNSAEPAEPCSQQISLVPKDAEASFVTAVPQNDDLNPHDSKATESANKIPLDCADAVAPMNDCSIADQVGVAEKHDTPEFAEDATNEDLARDSEESITIGSDDIFTSDCSETSEDENVSIVTQAFPVTSAKDSSIEGLIPAAAFDPNEEPEVVTMGGEIPDCPDHRVLEREEIPVAKSNDTLVVDRPAVLTEETAMEVGDLPSLKNLLLKNQDAYCEATSISDIEKTRIFPQNSSLLSDSIVDGTPVNVNASSVAMPTRPTAVASPPPGQTSILDKTPTRSQTLIRSDAALPPSRLSAPTTSTIGLSGPSRREMSGLTSASGSAAETDDDSPLRNAEYGKRINETSGIHTDSTEDESMYVPLQPQMIDPLASSISQRPIEDSTGLVPGCFDSSTGNLKRSSCLQDPGPSKKCRLESESELALPDEQVVPRDQLSIRQNVDCQTTASSKEGCVELCQGSVSELALMIENETEINGKSQDQEEEQLSFVDRDDLSCQNSDIDEDDSELLISSDESDSEGRMNCTYVVRKPRYGVVPRVGSDMMGDDDIDSTTDQDMELYPVERPHHGGSEFYKNSARNGDECSHRAAIAATKRECGIDAVSDGHQSWFVDGAKKARLDLEVGTMNEGIDEADLPSEHRPITPSKIHLSGLSRRQAVRPLHRQRFGPEYQ